MNINMRLILTCCVIILWSHALLANADSDTNNENELAPIKSTLKQNQKLRRALLRVLTDLEQQSAEAKEIDNNSNDTSTTTEESVTATPEVKKVFNIHTFSEEKSNISLSSVGSTTEIYDEVEVTVLPESKETIKTSSTINLPEPKSNSLNDTIVKTKTEEKKSVSDDGASEQKAEDVQFFQAPLVAAFTVHQDELGLPRSVIPLYKDAEQNSVTAQVMQQLKENGLTREQSLKQQSLEDRQRLLEEQLYQIQRQRLQEDIYQREIFARQQRQLELEQQYKIEEEQKQRSLLLQQQQQSTLLSQQQQQLQSQQQLQQLPVSNQQFSIQTQQIKQLPITEQRFQLPIQNQQLQQLEIQNQQSQQLPFQNQQLNQLPIQNQQLQQLEIQNQQSQQLPIQNQQSQQLPFQNQQLNQLPIQDQQLSKSNQQFVLNQQQLQQQNFPQQQFQLPLIEQRTKFNQAKEGTFISFQPSISLPLVNSAQFGIIQQQLPNREAIDFLRQQKLPFSQLPLEQNHLPAGINLSLDQRLPQVTRQNNFNLDPVSVSGPIRNSNRVFRQETNVGNFGINNGFNSFRQQPTFALDRHLQSLLQQSGINRGRSNEDLNIVSKVLSLDHFGRNFIRQ